MALGPKRRETGISRGKGGFFSPVFWIFGVPGNTFALDAEFFSGLLMASNEKVSMNEGCAAAGWRNADPLV